LYNPKAFWFGSRFGFVHSRIFNKAC